jgi:CubicO group peptidase (beta-lactamase class C family)
MNAPCFIEARIAAESPDRADGHVRVPWWSFTKTALAAACLRLVAQGALRLDAPIEGRPYTLRHLLQHRSGVPDYGGLPAYHAAVARGDAPWSVAELLDRVEADRLMFRPGQGWCYSNVGYLFVRQLIERATGQDIGGALRELLFDALGLGSVRVALSASDLADIAWGNPNSYDPGWVYHGLLVGSAGDAARLLHALMTANVLPPALLAEMGNSCVVAGLVPGRPWRSMRFGLGVMIGETADLGKAVGHSGAGPGSVSAVYHFGDRTPPCTYAAFAAAEVPSVVEDRVLWLAAGSSVRPVQ